MIKQEFDTGTFYNSDTFEAMKLIPDNSVDMILADLPYGTTQNKWDSVIPFEKLWHEYWRIAKQNAPVVLTAQCPFDKMLGASQIKYLKYEWIWKKSKATGHLNAKKQPMKNVENVLVFYRQQCLYNPQGLIKKEQPTVRRGGDNGKNYGKSEKSTLQTHEGYPRQVLGFNSHGSTIHPTQKPVALFEYMIKTYTKEGDTVLDNVAGSGTTAIAAMNTGRKWICIERDVDYYEKAIERVKQNEL